MYSHMLGQLKMIWRIGGAVQGAGFRLPPCSVGNFSLKCISKNHSIKVGKGMCSRMIGNVLSTFHLYVIAEFILFLFLFLSTQQHLCKSAVRSSMLYTLCLFHPHLFPSLEVASRGRGSPMYSSDSSG